MSISNDYPSVVPVSMLNTERLYTRVNDYWAIRETDTRDEQARDESDFCVLKLSDGDNIYKVFPSSYTTPNSVIAVYQCNGSELFIPTGRIFIRCDEGIKIEELIDNISELGFVISHVPNYAPHTAWLERMDGNIAESLRNLSALHQLPNVRNVEPQFLTVREWR